MKVRTDEIARRIAYRASKSRPQGRYFYFDRTSTEGTIYVCIDGHYVLKTGTDWIDVDAVCEASEYYKTGAYVAEKKGFDKLFTLKGKKKLLVLGKSLVRIGTSKTDVMPAMVFNSGEEEDDIWINPSFFTTFTTCILTKDGEMKEGYEFYGTNEREPVLLVEDGEIKALFLPFIGAR